MGIHVYCQRLGTWLDDLQKEWELSSNLTEFEERLGVKRGTIRNIKSGSLPKLDKVVQLVSASGIGWERFGEIVEPDADMPTESDRKAEEWEAILAMLLALHNDVRRIEGTNPQDAEGEITENRFMEMIGECMVGKSEEMLKAQMRKVYLKELNWEVFQAIASGIRQPQSPREVEEIKTIVDPELPGKYSLSEWLYAYCFWVLRVNRNGNIEMN
ncbi:MAG: hypothetical protein J7647_07760 [Cyanobacteria bacterium SBLK]|nr:hypothetical protein [Cyanobacteria bacterium SBLK]